MIFGRGPVPRGGNTLSAGRPIDAERRHCQRGSMERLLFDSAHVFLSAFTVETNIPAANWERPLARVDGQ
jgi:hypothetical protein